MITVSKPWLSAVIAWVGVILFSSTSLAQIWADQTYLFFTGQLHSQHHEHGWPYLFADKGFHVTLFCIFALLLCQALQTAPRQTWLVILSGAVLGSCSEYLQSFFPGRDPAIRDVIINIAGTVLGVYLYSFLFQRFPLKRRPVSAASRNL